MGHPILTALFLAGAGALMMFRFQDMAHRWIGFALVSAGLNIAAGISNEIGIYALIIWIIAISALLIVCIFEDPKRKR